MITLEKAIELAREELGSLDYIVTEYSDQYVFEPDRPTMAPGVGVNKKTGSVRRFFPPDYSLSYRHSGKKISIKKYL